MANYNCVIRTNYFHVKNNTMFEDFMKTVYGEDEVFMFKKGDMYGFGCYGEIMGIRNPEDENEDEYDSPYDAFIDGLQKHVTDNDAVIIMEFSNEKLRHISGTVGVITSKKVKYMDTTDLAMDIAKKLLNNKNYETQFQILYIDSQRNSIIYVIDIGSRLMQTIKIETQIA